MTETAGATATAGATDATEPTPPPAQPTQERTTKIPQEETTVATKTADPDAKDGENQAGKGGKMKLIIMLAPTVLLVGALAWFLFLKPAPEAVPAEEPPPVPGVVVKLEPVTINLAAGHYLKLGMTLQATAEVKEAPDGSKALDEAIALYSGMSIEEISSSDGRESTKEELIEKVKEKYEDEIYDIYYTTFVYQ
jgi:flagellar FliL protein